jgi:endonuclease YncB( thermonuclease family)
MIVEAQMLIVDAQRGYDMGSIQIDGTLWLTRPPRTAAPNRTARAKRRLTLLASRVALVAAVAGGASLLTIGLSGPDSPTLVGAAVASAEARPKDGNRLSAWPPGAARGAPAVASADAHLVIAGAVASILPAKLTPAAAQVEEWREESFQVEAAIDGRTFLAGGRRVALSDLALPKPEATCRRLDGVIEACARRATTQLDLLTRWRTLTCRVRGQGAGDLVGSCRLGGEDLADRLVRAGYVERTTTRVADASRS